MGLELKHEFSMWASLKPPIDFGAGPLGQRIFAEVIEGEATGDRFNAQAVGGGGDWLLIAPDGYGRIDVRLQFATDDGAHVYMQYLGLLEMNETVAQALASGRATAFEDQYFRTTPRVETGDPRYTWMAHSVFVARGKLREGFGVEYEVFRAV
ncbi:DUF3237 domain-containing protein [Mycolicibacterium pulveris]|uniref:UPF0311 protein MPUL_10600 n=1 Tax=Mycolicibacterium pulveris TaxID=36813 RepID=A0A7I7UEZ6_MYCPV|nr:DUF3237 domain-containing protein [Mycolicibacterium pulveris]MCV6978897.1 DUF3237 domain-containing protein [Mycolicibacterium pulveris]BBY79902.1 UPF0311 protein [Mycolicibacterium pulveris]